MKEQPAKLIICSEAAGIVGQEIALVQDVITLGRAPTCQIVIESDFASRRHAQIVRRDQNYWLRDLGSKNGTLLDGNPVNGEMLLSNGMEVAVGAARFRFMDPSATRTHPVLALGSTPLRVDPTMRAVWVYGEKLDPPLSLKQFNLLSYLYLRAGEAVSKDEIAAAVWPETDTGIYDYQVDKMISRVRDRIGKEWIETVWGYGYRLVIK